MTPGERLQQASITAVNRFASHGYILEPQVNVYTPSTGKQEMAYIPHKLEYVVVKDETVLNTDLKASSFRNKLLYFTVDNTLEIDETWAIVGDITANESEFWVTQLDREVWVTEELHSWVTERRLGAVVWDIKTVEKIEANDIIIGYNVLTEVRL